MSKVKNKMRKKMWGWSFAIALFLPMVACQEDTDLKQGSDATNKTLEEVFISNNPADFEGRVTNFKAPKAVVRSVADAYDVPEMPEQPEVPADAIDMDGYQSWNCQSNTAYVLNAEQSYSGDVYMNGNTYYIQGNLTLTNYWGTGTFVILPGGTLVYPKNMTLNSIKVYNYGTFTLSSKDFTTNAGSTFMTQGDFACEGELKAGGDFYVGGNLDAPTLDANNDLRMFVGEKATFTKAQISNQSTIYLEKLEADEFEVNSASTVIVGCSAYINKKFYLTNGIDFKVLGYLQSPVTELDSNAKLSVNSGCWMSLGDLSIKNANTVNISVAGEDGAYGVVQAKNISVNLNDLRGTFTGYMGLHYETLQGNGSQAEIQFLSQVLINEDDDTSIAETECSPAFNYTPGSSNDGKEEIVIDHIAEVTSPDLNHTHDISATCVQMANGNKAYVSYHQQGPKYSGCVEVMEVAADQVTLKSYMRSEEARDFNHLIVDNNRIYAVGGDNKGGALIATIGLTDGVFQSGDADGLEVIRLKGNGNETVHDANCIVRNGNYYQVASTNGFATLQADNMEEVNFVATPGSAKFIHMDGQGNLVTLNLGDKNDVQSAAVVNRYNVNDYNFANAITTFNDGIIKPVDGKNVCKVDGSNIYLCLGQNGFKRYTNGTENGGFSLEGTNAAVNGMDYDDRYLYLAYGSEGLYVLDKETLDVVASYTHSGGKSANYVKVDEGYIYVAYGRSGLQVFKLTTKK